MNEKNEILRLVSPLAVLKPLTPEALDAIPPCCAISELICIRSFPFRVGRESRVHQVNGRIEIMERPKGSSERANNDLYLVDRGQLLNISREHFFIALKDGSYVLTDRGSACGTKVNDDIIGGNDNPESIAIQDGAVISVGSDNTKYIYKFIVLL